MKKGKRNGSNESQDNVKVKAEAARALGCNVMSLSKINETDPFNPSNEISGYICRDQGPMFGSVYIISVNGQNLPRPEVIYGMPAINDVGKLLPSSNNSNRSKSASSYPSSSNSSNSDDSITPAIQENQPKVNPWTLLPPCARFFVANKWNGTNVTVFKYNDHLGHMFISVMPRGHLFLKGNFNSSSGHSSNTNQNNQSHNSNSIYDNSSEIYSILCEHLRIPLNSRGYSAISGGSSVALKAIFPILEQKMVQSISYEMIGKKVQQLVVYESDLELKPLIATMWDGTIIPQALLSADVLPVKEGENPLLQISIGLGDSGVTFRSSEDDASKRAKQVILTGELGPYDFDSALIASIASDFKKKAYQLNAEYRESRNLPEAYRNGNYVVEGKIICLLNDQNCLVSRSNSMFKLKPWDIQKSRYELFDVNMQTLVFEAAYKISARGLSFGAKNLQAELDWNDSLWSKFGKNALELLKNRPNPTYRSNPETSQSNKSNPKLLIVMGLPGSGKSTFANKLVHFGWTRVNQDEMGHRKAVESQAKSALMKGQSVIVDRCNFDYDQRAHFLELAASVGVNDVYCLWLDTPHDVCKSRVSTRKDHPTIPEGDAGVAIIDRFSSMLVPPMLGEGFTQILRASNDLEIDMALETYAKLLAS